MTLPVESDARLAYDVGGPARAIALTGVPGMGSQISPFLLPATPWEFLLAAGRATAANSPAVRELFYVSSHWAVARWFWALDWGASQVRVSSHAELIRNHHRTAFSEAMGLAAGLLVVERLAGESAPPSTWRGGPLLVDVDTFVSSGRRPDLLILFGGPSGQLTYVLETKGNSRGRNYSVGQLERGIPQVLAAQGPARRLVVAAAATDADLSVQAISVESPDGQEPRRLLTAAEERAPDLERSRLASFAGVAGPGAEGELHTIPELELDVVGRRFVLPTERLTAELIMGVDREIFRRLPQARSVSDLSSIRSKFAPQARGSIGEIQPTLPLTETGRAAAVAVDGCALAVRLL